MNERDDMDKILDRIRKLLAMANDVSSPNEAAIAARRAEAMMRKYQVDHADVLVDTLSASDVNEEYQWTGSRVELWKQGLSIAVAKACECEVKFRGRDFEKGLVFVGVGPDPIVAAELYAYLVATTKRLAQEGGYDRKGQNSFMRGCAHELGLRLKELTEEKAKDFSTSSGTALVLHKRHLIEQAQGKFQYGKGKSSHYADSEYYKGREAGKYINLQEQLK